MIKQLVAALAVVLISSAAQAHNHRHYRHHHHQPNHRTIDKLPTVGRSSIISCNQYGCRGSQSKRTTDRPIRQARHYNSGRGVIGGRPAGCPHAFCGCGTSLHIFGRIIPSLNLAANWFHFPRANPAPGMVAVRNHHVFAIESVNGDGTVVAFDSNSGGHRTRIHTISLRGYSVRNPHGTRIASR